MKKTVERVLEFLKQQGFCPDVDEENGNILFKYQMNTSISTTKKTKTSSRWACHRFTT